MSFLVIAIFWVNHHHFTQTVLRTDWKLLWFNNLLLFWLAIIPFTTAFWAENPLEPVALSVYSFILCMAALAFWLMIRYVFFHSDLLDGKIALNARRREARRATLGVFLYALGALAAPLTVWISIAVLIIVPLAYLIPVAIGQD
jgi:uncharacterized membrane protein